MDRPPIEPAVAVTAASEAGGCPPAPPRRLSDPRVHAAIRRIEEDAGADVRLGNLATEVGLSPFHFHRLFLDTMGETPGAYARRVRLGIAAKLLLRGDDRITAIAIAVGYGSLAAFSRGFRRQFGCTPQGFRDQGRSGGPKHRAAHAARARHVRVRRHPQTRVFAMRFHGAYHRVEEHWREFAEALRMHGVDLEAQRLVGIARDNPALVPAELARYDCALLADGDWTPPPALAMAAHAWPERRYALIDHVGPYPEVARTYDAFASAWLPDSGERIARAPALELYREAPWRNAGGEQRLTLACALR